MKNKKMLLIIGVLVVVLLLVGYFLFWQKKSFKQEYVIKEWNSYAQNVMISIDDDTIVKYIKSTENDASPEVETGGENTLFTITGLKKGSATVYVDVLNDDGVVESSKKYYFEVNDDLKVRLVKVSDTKNYVIKKWHIFSQRVVLVVDNDKVIKAIKSDLTDNSENATGGKLTLYTLTGLKKGSTEVTVSVLNDDGSPESSETYYFEVNNKLELKLVKTEVNSSVIDVD